MRSSWLLFAQTGFPSCHNQHNHLNVWISGDKLNLTRRNSADAPNFKISVLHALKNAILGSFSDLLNYIHTANMQAHLDKTTLAAVFADINKTSCFGRFVLDKSFWEIHFWAIFAQSFSMAEYYRCNPSKNL